MTLADRKVIDDFIRKYLLLDTRIKIAKAKIKHAEYENNRFTVNKQKNILHLHTTSLVYNLENQLHTSDLHTT